MSLCFVRIEELANIDLSVSIIDEEEHTAANWERADQRFISTRHERLVQTLRVQNATVNFIIHASSTEVAALMNQNFYSFAISRKQDSIASKFVNNHGEKQATQIISKLRGDTRVSDGDGLQQSPQGDDFQLSPQETLASPLSLPINSSQPIVEAESPNDHESANVLKSQMQKDNQDVEPQNEVKDS
ncbi:MAG: hypothetical protein EZS28_005198 [Streblomastix strix]|uniref:Uncharacterized protein n=1 Tax=Streblomastix strix TaxID=222440 RepID=A0A5J4WW86_9EUKA|nr:MAG: hypothetical protein EZS28_005198 [Streblomastix strix]